jgi:hypothetical protein
MRCWFSGSAGWIGVDEGRARRARDAHGLVALFEQTAHQQHGLFEAVEQVDGVWLHIEVTGFNARGTGQVVGQCLQPACAALSSLYEAERRLWFELVEIFDEHVQAQAQTGERIAQLVGDGV